MPQGIGYGAPPIQMGPPADEQDYQQRVQGWLQVLQNPQAQDMIEKIAANRGIGAFGARLAENVGTPGTTPLASLGNAYQAGQAVQDNTQGQVLRGSLALAKSVQEGARAEAEGAREDRRLDIDQQRVDQQGAHYRTLAQAQRGAGGQVPMDLEERLNQITAFIGPMPSLDNYNPGEEARYEADLQQWRQNARGMWGDLYPGVPFPARGMPGFATQAEQARRAVFNMTPEQRAELRSDPELWGSVQQVFTPEELEQLFPQPDPVPREGDGRAPGDTPPSQANISLRSPYPTPDYSASRRRVTLRSQIDWYKTTRDPRLLPNLTMEQLNAMVQRGEATGADVREFIELKRAAGQNSLNLPSDMSSMR